MRVTFFAIAISLFALACGQATPGISPGEVLIFKGEVLDIAPHPGIVSGNLAVYRLAKYRVWKVCVGQYNAREIVIDHLVLTGKELESLKVGDQVCVTAQKSNRILNRYNVEGIRKASEAVEYFYISGEVDPAETAPRDC